ncbi:hypothetical protein [Pseudaminobacter sp. NGMCC 1.201702]|uniref:hypothetical protein n=1 Tax=Pseudaminobacter sp. NGMCC 1.201702 TaxID=3391825 RepID=UPI0039EFD249
MAVRLIVSNDNPGGELKSGDGGGTYGSMEARVAKLEGIAEDTRKTLETIQRQLARIDTKLDAKPDIDKVYKAIFTVYGLSFTIIAAGAAVLALILR